MLCMCMWWSLDLTTMFDKCSSTIDMRMQLTLVSETSCSSLFTATLVANVCMLVLVHIANNLTLSRSYRLVLTCRAAGQAWCCLVLARCLGPLTTWNAS